MPRCPDYYRSAFKDFLYEKWIDRWENGADPSFARQTKIWYKKPLFRKARRLLSLPRDEFSRAVRWLTGHAFLGLQDFRAGTVAVSVCRLCALVPERADHLLLECPGLSNTRTECFGAFGPRVDNDEWEIGEFLRYLERIGAAEMEKSPDAAETSEGDSDEEAQRPVVAHAISTSESD